MPATRSRTDRQPWPSSWLAVPPHRLAAILVCLGLEPNGYDGIGGMDGYTSPRLPGAFGTAMNEALQTHLQRIVRSLSGPPPGELRLCGAGQSAAMELNRWRLGRGSPWEPWQPDRLWQQRWTSLAVTTKMPAGSLAPLAVAEGAIAAYTDVTGETW